MKLNLCSFTYAGSQLFILYKFPSTTLSQVLQTQEHAETILSVRRFEGSLKKKRGIEQISEDIFVTPCLG